MEDKETKTRTTDERVEQAAHNIIAACEMIRELTDGRRHGTKYNKVNRAALSAQFHAEGILGSDQRQLNLFARRAEYWEAFRAVTKAVTQKEKP